MIKHTPGPWKASDEGQTILIWADAQKDYIGEAYCYDSKDHSMESADANAALISAAPELLEKSIALDTAFCVCYESDEEEREAIRVALNKLRVAIAKATGGQS